MIGLGCERENSFFTPKDQRKFSRFEEMLKRFGGFCEIEILAVAHDWEPGNEIVLNVLNADIVTLELTRNVVTAGLEGTRSNILRRNIFWREIIGQLRGSSKDKLIRGVEVNQTTRNAWKRFSLHYNISTLSSSIFTVEVQDVQKGQFLQGFLSGDEIHNFQKYGWIIVDRIETALGVLNLATQAANRIEKGELAKNYPVPLTDNLVLVAENIKEEADSEGHYPVTFMKPPDPSLIKARELIIKELEPPPFALTEREKKGISMDAMCAFLLSHAELKDAEELLYNTYQFASKNLQQGKRIKAVHVGGAVHAKNIEYILNSQITDADVIRVSVKDDPRFPSSQRGKTISAFFQDAIPISDLIKGVKIEGFETYENSEYIASLVKEAIYGNLQEFEKRLTIKRIIDQMHFDDSFASEQALIQTQSELYALDIESLRDRMQRL